TFAERGPGTGPLDVRKKYLANACPTILIRKDGKPMVISTNYLKRPKAMILDSQNGSVLASLYLERGTLLGGVYAYLDQQERLVMVDGDNNLIRIKARHHDGDWSLFIDETLNLGPHMDQDDGAVSLVPDGQGATWIGTKKARILVVKNSSVTSLDLDPGEEIHNSISATLDGHCSVITDHKIYVLGKDRNGNPRVKWKAPYDRGRYRKVGQLSQGSGASPTFFGGDFHSRYVMLTDNADAQMNLIVYLASNGRKICEIPVFSFGSHGTENSAIGFGRTIIVASTYGYPYPAGPGGAAPVDPAREDDSFRGGMWRIDIREDESGADVVWQSPVRSAAVPKYSLADGNIYTIEEREERGPLGLLKRRKFYFQVIDGETGVSLTEGTSINGFGHNLQFIPVAMPDPLQMAGNIGPDGVYWQGTIQGVIRFSPSP
ncbi:MAG: hypothetical protein QF645_06710, partial [Planctomycetota bacterium]|nr:hypothetical protein [Planctomycetota bacterium]